MPRFIVKPNPDRDEYVEWSTITDTPSVPFTRAEWLADNPDETARLDRADANGTSCRVKSGNGWWFGWHETEFRVQDMRGRGFVTVPRADLPAAGRATANGEVLSITWPEVPLNDEDDQ